MNAEKQRCINNVESRKTIFTSFQNLKPQQIV